MIQLTGMTISDETLDGADDQIAVSGGGNDFAIAQSVKVNEYINETIEELNTMSGLKPPPQGFPLSGGAPDPPTPPRDPRTNREKFEDRKAEYERENGEAQTQEDLERLTEWVAEQEEMDKTRQERLDEETKDRRSRSDDYRWRSKDRQLRTDDTEPDQARRYREDEEALFNDETNEEKSKRRDAERAKREERTDDVFRCSMCASNTVGERGGTCDSCNEATGQDEADSEAS